MTIRRHESGYLCTEVDAGRLTESEVIRWMHQTGWPGHTQIECWQWRDGEYIAWKARKEKAGKQKRSIVKITELARPGRLDRRKARRPAAAVRATAAAVPQLAAHAGAMPAWRGGKDTP